MTENASQTKKYRLPIRRPVTTAMVFLTLVVFGWKSYQGLPLNLMPDISYPTLTVRTEYEGAAPEDVEKMLTRPLEETLSIVSGLVEISSTSSAGLSEIVMEFTWGTDMSLAQQEVRDRLDLFDPPKDVTEKPVILRYDPTLDPVMRVAIRGANESNPEVARQQLLEIREAAEEQVKSDLEGEPGIAQVLVKGGREEEIQILLDSQRLSDLGLTPVGVSTALAQRNISQSGGTLREGKTEYIVRTHSEFKDVGEIRETIIATIEGAHIKLKDVATVELGEKERETVVRIDGQEAVELEIYKWGDSNTVQVCNKLKDLFEFEREPSLIERLKALAKKEAAEKEGAETPGMPGELVYYQTAREMAMAQTLRKRLPDYAELTLINDQSRFIVAAIKEVQSSAVMGGFLALVILYFFLRKINTTLIIGISIPISVIATFVPMFMRDVSINIMSLGGLALGVGMLVDDSIIVLESIFRCAEEGDGTVDAANRGTQEVAAASTASTLTTIAVFLPLAFVEGVAGQLFRDQALTVTFSLSASLLVALFLIPMIASRQKISLISGKQVVWILKAYRQARDSGHGIVTSIILVIPYGLRNAWFWFEKAGVDTFKSLGSGIVTLREAVSREGFVGRAFKGALVLLGIAVLVVAGLYVAVGHARGQGAAVTAAGAALAVFVALPFGAVVLIVLLPAMLVVIEFVVHVILQITATFLITLLFLISMLVLGVVGGIAKLMHYLLWIPLKLFDISFAAFAAAYVKTLRWSLPLAPAVLLVVAALAVHCSFVATRLGRELIPPMKQGEFGIRMEAPPGTRLADTESRARFIEALAMELPEVDTVAVEVGQEKTRAENTRGENVAEFTVMLKNPDKNAARQDEIIERLRGQIARITSDEITFTLPTLFSFNTAIELQVRGDDLHELKRVGERALAAVMDVPGLKDAELSMKEGYPEIIIELDRDLCAANGLDPESVATRLRTEVHGDKPTQFNRAGSKIDMRVRTDQARLQSLDDLRNLTVREGRPPIPLSSVAKISVQEGPSEIRRIDQRQVALISANVEGRDLGSVSEDIMERLRTVEKPLDYQFVLGGQNRELETSLASLQFALILAVFLVYVVMACQFESIWQPAIVMFSVPLAFIGVIYVLAWLNVVLSIVVYIGGIILAGIVVNDAIILVDYVNQLRDRGFSKRDAVVQAGSVRLRPILMTTLTTVLGLVPMAIGTGEGTEIRMPMAVTVMAGLSSATILTLFIIPMIYDLFGKRDTA